MNHGWEHLKIEDCFEYIKNGANIKQSKEASGYPVTRIETLSNGVFNRNKVGYANIFNLDKYEANVLCNGDLLMSHINSSKFLGRTVVYHARNDEIYIHGMNLLRLIPNKIIVSDFFYYVTLTHYFRSKISQIRKDAVNQSSFSISDLKKILIPIPPKEIQEQIVCELDKLNELIEIKRNQLKDLDTLAQSLFYSMFNDLIAKKNNWPQCCIGEIYKFQYGKGNKIPESNGTYPCYGSNGIVGFHTKYNSEDAPIIGHIGAYAGIVNWGKGKHFVTYNGVMCWLKSTSNNPIFGYYLLKAQNYMKMARNGAAQPFVSYDGLEKPLVYLPPLYIQEQFAERIEAIEAQRAKIESSITDLETLLASRMDYWFND